MLPAQHLTDKFSDKLVDIVDHLADKYNQLFPLVVGGDQNTTKRRVNIGLKYARWKETQVFIAE